MKKSVLYLLLILASSCGDHNPKQENRIISVSIAPFKFFIKEIAGNTFDINIMVPAGSNPHIYEPYPDQVRKLGKSVAYISDGFLGFEITWLDRFYEMNRNMKKLSLGTCIDPISDEDHGEGNQAETADPHFWVSPACAFRIALSVRDFLTGLDPSHREMCEKNYLNLIHKIGTVDSLARDLASCSGSKDFMIYHPNLAYLARDYGLHEIPVEFEGKEPSPSRMKYLIDVAIKEKMKTILVQKEYDTKNARAIVNETGGRVVLIDPLSEDWPAATTDIINKLKEEFEGAVK